MKKRSNTSPPNVKNSTKKDLKDNEVLEIANNEHKRTIMRMINEIKGEI
jgi:hypothetical protein